jgi:large subunit ribosomal protein L54
MVYSSSMYVLSFLQAGKDPTIQPDTEYPEWLWSLELPVLGQLNAKGVDNLTPAELRRYYQLKSTLKIKTQNEEKAVS